MGVSGNSVASSLSLQTHIVMYCHIYVYIYIGLYRVILGVHLTFSDAPILNMYQPTNHLGVGSARRRNA